jgi:MFS family permease
MDANQVAEASGEEWRGTVRFLWFVQFLTTLAMNLGLTFIPFVLRDDPVLAIPDESSRLFYVSLILGAPFLSTIVFTPLWGWVADRTGPRRQVIRACFGLGLTQLLMAVAQTADQMVLIRVLQGMVSGVLSACLGMVTSVTPLSHQGRAVALVHSATPAGQVLGPLIGGVLAVSLGFRLTYLLLGTVIVLVAVLSLFALPRRAHRATVSPNPLTSLWSAIKINYQMPRLPGTLLILVLAHFAFTLSQGVFAIFAAKVWQTAVSAPGDSPGWMNDIGFVAVALAATALTNALCGPWWGHWQDQGRGYLQSMGATLLAVANGVLVFWPAAWVVLLSRIGIGMGLGAMTSLPFSEVSRSTPADSRGQMMGLTFALSQIGNLAGFLLGGWLAALWSEQGNFLLSAVLYGSIALLAGLLYPGGAGQGGQRPRT